MVRADRPIDCATAFRSKPSKALGLDSWACVVGEIRAPSQSLAEALNRKAHRKSCKDVDSRYADHESTMPLLRRNLRAVMIDCLQFYTNGLYNPGYFLLPLSRRTGRFRRRVPKLPSNMLRSAMPQCLQTMKRKTMALPAGGMLLLRGGVPGQWLRKLKCKGISLIVPMVPL